MRRRVLSAAVAGPLFLAVLWVGGPWVVLMSVAMAWVGAHELGRIVRARDVHMVQALTAALATLWILAAASGRPSLLLGPLVVVTLLASGVAWVAVPRVGPVGGMASLFGALYLGVPLSALVLIEVQFGRWPAILAFLMVFASDVAGYFVGRGLGRRPLQPELSPNKTMEGSAGALLGAVAVGWLGHRVLGLGVVPGLILGALSGILAQYGDLAESALKRWAGVKDSGGLLPGHGGMLDRMDSVFFVLPVVYYFLVIWGFR